MLIWVLTTVDLARHDAGRTHLLEKWSKVAEAGHDVALWAFAEEASEVWHGLKVRSPGRIHLRGLSGPSYAVSLLASVLWHVGRRPPDAIYIRASPPTALVALALSRMTRIPVVFELPGPIAEEARLYGVSERKVALIRSSAARSMRGAAAVVTVTQGIKRQLVREYGISEHIVHVVGNGVNTELFRPRPAPEARAHLGLEAPGPILGFVGNLHRWQGTEFLLEAAPTILTAVSDAEVHIVGDGVMRETLEEIASRLGVRDRVRFHGGVPYSAAPDFIAACDVLVAPLIPKPTGDSGYSPLKLYEYLACGRPVVASRLDGLEVVEREDLGRLVPAADADALARAVIEVLSDDRARADMGDRARRVALERFGWNKAAEETIEIVRAVARPR